MELTEVKNMVVKKIMELFPEHNIDTEMITYVDLVDDWGMDSIVFISIVIEFESLFNITIPDEKLLLNNFRRLNDIVDIVNKEIVEKSESELEVD